MSSLFSGAGLGSCCGQIKCFLDLKALFQPFQTFGARSVPDLP
jgi:hypothetical protein